MVRGFAILLLCLLLGELIVRFCGISLPGNVAGMVLLLFALRLGLVRLDQVKEAANLLLSNLALLFVPAGVGVMVYLDIIQTSWLPILASLVLSTFAVLLVTGKVAQRLKPKSGESCDD